MNIETPAQDNETLNPQPEIDTSAAIAEISSDLFGQESDGESESEVEREEAPVVPSTVELPPEGEENSAEVKETGAPGTWTKEALQEWAAIPLRAQQEILKREDDMMKGIAQYKSAADLAQRYESVVEPYKPILQAEGVDPVELFNSFAGNHYLLTRGTPAQKIELAANMLTHYGVDLPALLDHFGDKALETHDPEITSLRAELNTLKSQINQQATASTQQLRAKADAEIETFSTNPANIYFNELVDDIAKLLSTGVAETLPEAYEKAVYANPVTRQKEIDRLTADKQSSALSLEQARADKIARSTATDVKATSHQRNGTVPLGSMDDTLNETLAAINARK
jgi:hypothetical protein